MSQLLISRGTPPTLLEALLPCLLLPTLVQSGRAPLARVEPALTGKLRAHAVDHLGLAGTRAWIACVLEVQP